MEEEAFAQRYSTQEKLLLAQAVHKLGAAQWEGISSLLVNHPCLVEKEGRDELFNPKACEEAYVGLMTGIGVNVPAEGGTKPHAKPHLRLAQTFYFQRMAELKASIANYEKRFETLMSEIQMIKSGEMDAAIATELRAVLARKVGKKLLDTWVPEPKEVREAVEAGPISEDERQARIQAEAAAQTGSPLNGDQPGKASVTVDAEPAETVDGEGTGLEKPEADAKRQVSTEIRPSAEPAETSKVEGVSTAPPKTKKQLAAEAKRRKAEEAEAGRRKKAEEAEQREAEEAAAEQRRQVDEAEKSNNEGGQAEVLDDSPREVSKSTDAQLPIQADDQPAGEEGPETPLVDAAATADQDSTIISDAPVVTDVPVGSPSSNAQKPDTGPTDVAVSTDADHATIDTADPRSSNTGTRKGTRRSLAADERPLLSDTSRTRSKRGRKSDTPAKEQGKPAKERGKPEKEQGDKEHEGSADEKEAEAAEPPSPPALEAVVDVSSTQPDTARSERVTRRGKAAVSTPAPQADEDVEMGDQAETTEAPVIVPEVDPGSIKPNPLPQKPSGEQRSPVKPGPRSTRPETRRGPSRAGADAKNDAPAPPHAPPSPVKKTASPKPPPSARQRSPSEAASELSDLPDSKSPESPPPPPPPVKPPARQPLERKNTRGKAGQGGSGKKSQAAEVVEELHAKTAPSEAKENDAEDETEPPTMSASTRTAKRKAEQSPVDLPAGKRRGRRATSTAPTVATIPDSDVEDTKASKGKASGPAAETSEDQAAGNSRRPTRKSMPAPPTIPTTARRGRPRDSPALTALTRGSSPAASRRAASVTSTKSATPASKQDPPPTAKRGPGRPPRNRVKDTTPPDSEREDEPGSAKGKEQQDEPKPTRSSARKRGVEVDIDLTPASSDRAYRRTAGQKGKKEEEAEEEEEDEDEAEGEAQADDEPEPEQKAGPSKRPKRGSMRISHPPSQPAQARDESEPSEEDPADAVNGAGPAAVEGTEDGITPALSNSASPALVPAPSGSGAKGGSGRSLGEESHAKSSGGRARGPPQTRDQKATAKALMLLFDQVGAHRNGNLFQKPVRKIDAPDYDEIIKHPMDLDTVKRRIKNGQIADIDDFEQHIHLIFANAMLYNGKGTQIYDMAQEMLSAAESMIAHHRSMQTDVDKMSESSKQGAGPKSGSKKGR